MQKPFPKELYTKYELARILGARALQLSFNAPILIKIDKEQLEDIRYDPVKIAEMELDQGILPISIRRPLPKKLEKKKIKQDKEIAKLEKVTEAEEQTEKADEKSVKKIEQEVEKKAEKEVKEEAEELEQEIEEESEEGEKSEEEQLLEEIEKEEKESEE